MRGALLIGALICASTAVTAAGCTVGDGTGTATGPLWILGCKEGEPEGTPAAPKTFRLEPTFFAGEPLGDISSGPPINRLVIRMQRNGNAIQIDDTLWFDIPDSYEVARCLRGRVDPATGLPDWDTGNGSVDPIFSDMPWCEQNGPSGVPRIHLFPFGPVRASLTPLATCHITSQGPTVVSVTGVAMTGWIDFQAFGGAAPKPNQPPDERMQIDEKFVVNYGENLHADFHIDVGDDRVATALRRMIDVPPDPHIGGALDGDFEFDLERGRSAQTFP